MARRVLFLIMLLAATAVFSACGREKPQQTIGIITTVAGDGWVKKHLFPGKKFTFEAGRFAGDGGPAVKASLYMPQGVAVAADGSIYIADRFNTRVRKVSPAGVITTIAGDGHKGFLGDGGPASRARLQEPSDVAVGLDGSVYITDPGSSRVRRIDHSGTISTVAGNGRAGHSGDGGLATKARLGGPMGVAIGDDGSLYISEVLGNYIRKVSPQGIIMTIAGNGRKGYSGDGGPATKARLNLPTDIALGADGSVYVAEMMNNRVRKVSPSGTISTVAGDGWTDKRGWGRFKGDGGDATKASLHWPTGVAVGGNGSLYIADMQSYRVRRVGSNGLIATVAGNGRRGYSGDGGAAINASLNLSFRVALAGDGTLYIADEGNHRIRKVTWIRR